jgi:quercetin dioxygenase-like cupin family protein
MQIKSAHEVEAKVVEMEGASGTTMRLLIGPGDGAPNFNMRLFEVAPGGHTPLHSHPWEHEVYVLSGQGAVRTPAAEKAVSGTDCVFIPPGEQHQFANTGRQPLRFLCLVPRDSG